MVRTSMRLTRRQALRCGVAGLAAVMTPTVPAIATELKTPGVYIIEKDAFPNSVVEVATAVPAFVGYTEKALNGRTSLAKKPWRISSLGEFITYFGGAPEARFKLDSLPATSQTEPALTVKGGTYALTRTDGPHILYNAMRLFFQNGGGACYVVSVGGYDDALDPKSLAAGIDTLVKEQEPTLLVVPDAMGLEEKDARVVQQAMLAHCGGKMRNRFAILDLWGGFRDRSDPKFDPVVRFRDGLGVNFLDFAAAYYPWLETSIVSDRDVTFESVDPVEDLQKLLKADLDLPDEKPKILKDDPEDVKADKQRTIALFELVGDLEGPFTDPSAGDDQAAKVDSNSKPDKPTPDKPTKESLDSALRAISPAYVDLMKAIAAELNRLPPAAAMAGIYTMVDNSRGVWKAPANIGLAAVNAPSVKISHDEQEDLNVHVTGKSINAIRPFVGEGTLVWGARTLDGNSLDWRYVNVRRTMIMLEESIKLAAKAYVFEPNTANTWVTVKAMIENFLTGIWKRGGLAGAVPEDAFSVHVGLGETMTPVDILEGILRVTVLVAPARPAEYIEITFQQRMQKS